MLVSVHHGGLPVPYEQGQEPELQDCPSIVASEKQGKGAGSGAGPTFKDLLLVILLPPARPQLLYSIAFLQNGSTSQELSGPSDYGCVGTFQSQAAHRCTLMM